MKIAILYSVPTMRALSGLYADTEEDTKESAEEVLVAVRENGADAFLVPVKDDAIAETIAPLKADCLFNLIEWTGHDLPLVAGVYDEILKTGIPYTGSRGEVYIKTTDKTLMKKELTRLALPTARWQRVSNENEKIRSDFKYPVIIKPALEHCSIGLSLNAIVSNPYELRQRVNEFIRIFSQPMIVEEFIQGIELQITLLEQEQGLVVLPPAEIFFDEDAPVKFLTYESRWNEEHEQYKKSHVRLATLPPALAQIVDRVSRDTFTKFGFSDYCRLDTKISGNELIILEANSNPGLGDSDDYGMTVSYRAVGMTFADFVWKIVESCMKRNTST